MSGVVQWLPSPIGSPVKKNVYYVVYVILLDAAVENYVRLH